VGKDVKWPVSKFGRSVLYDFVAAFANVKLLFCKVLVAVVGFKSVNLHDLNLI
jgi:hypothetical protein